MPCRPTGSKTTLRIAARRIHATAERRHSSSSGPVGPHYPTFTLRKNNTLSDYKKQSADKLRVDPKATTDVQVLENTPTRLKVKRVEAASPAGGDITDWTVLTGGDPICYAMISVGNTDPHDSPADRAAVQKLLPQADQIVASFTSAK